MQTKSAQPDRVDAAELKYAELIAKAAREPLRWPDNEALNMFAHLIGRTQPQIDRDIQTARHNLTQPAAPAGSAK